MQKANLSDLGTVLLVDKRTGETIPWEGITEISSDDLEEAEVVACSFGNKMLEILGERAEMIRKGFCDAITDTFPDDKAPNPIYIPKHVQHRKKGRR